MLQVEEAFYLFLVNFTLQRSCVTKQFILAANVLACMLLLHTLHFTNALGTAQNHICRQFGHHVWFWVKEIGNNVQFAFLRAYWFV